MNDDAENLDPFGIAEIADSFSAVCEVITGMRNSLVQQGWSPENAATIAVGMAQRFLFQQSSAVSE